MEMVSLTYANTFVSLLTNGVIGLAINDTRHHETEEVRNAEGKLILPAGQIVDKDYTIPNPLVKYITPNNIPAKNLTIKISKEKKSPNSPKK